MGHTAPITARPATLIIAEAGVNHNGNLDLALRLCDEACAAGADVVKFQTWKTESLMLPDTPLAPYQQVGGDHADQYAMAKSLELPYADFVTISDHCRNIGIRFLSTPDEVESLHFLVQSLGLTTIKVGSGELTNLPFLAQIGSYGLEVILSTGMSGLGEIEVAVELLRSSGCGPITLLHCTSQYPAPFYELNLRAIPAMAEYFGVPVGYSDHSCGMEAAVAAVALGATVIEKHFTLDCSLDGPDHRASMEPEPFREMVTAIRNIETALGDGVKRMQPGEAATRQAVGKHLVAAAPIQEGEIFTAGNVVGMRSKGGIPASAWHKYNGMPARRNYQRYEPIDPL
jgi:N,N'-diacetyllegionaminate synthase